MNAQTCFVWLLSGWVLLVITSIRAWPNAEGEVIFCNVGQGDGIIIQQGFSQIVIDAGPNNGLMLQCLEQHVPWWDQQLELVVATHPDSDHIGGLSTVVERYAIRELMLLPLSKQSADFEALKKSVSKNMGQKLQQVVIPAPGLSRVFPLGMRVKVLAAGISSVSRERAEQGSIVTTEKQLWDIIQLHESFVRDKLIESNNESIVLFLDMGETSMLFTGDLEQEGEAALLEQGVLFPVDVLKVAHHGSKTSSTLAFIQKTQPEWSIVSAGVKNSYGHPHPEVVRRLVESGTNLLRTDQLGSIIMFLESSRVRWRFEAS